MNQSLYSFIIPAFNDADGLARQFDYFAKVSARVELVIIDDASTDNTADVLRAAKLPANVDLKYHHNKENAGAGLSRNKGLTLASGDYIMFLDADDLLADCFFDYIARSPLKNGADFVLFKYHLAQNNVTRFSYAMHRVDAQLFSNMPQSGFPLKLYRLSELPGIVRGINYPWNKIYRREFLVASDVRFPDYRMHEDVLPHWRSFLRAKHFAVLNWAPPLIHHFESTEGGRATNYVGADRLDLFKVLKDVHADVATHESAKLLLPEFSAFCEDLFGWLLTTVAKRPDSDGKDWSDDYQAGIKTFRREVLADGKGGAT